MDVLTFKDVQKSFGEKQVLRALTLSVPEHSIFGFVGRNGAGKTTAMKAALGMLRIDGGEIFVAGERVVYGQTATNRYVGYLPDVPEFYPFMTAREYLCLCGESLQLGKSEIAARSEELLSLVGLADEKHRIKGYSRGMKQRLGIAQALLTRPKLLICDEPTSALDPIGRMEILDILLSVKDQTTVLFSTHILSDVERICTDVAFLNDGKIAQGGSVEELKRTRCTEQFRVEMLRIEDAERLWEAFADARPIGKGALLFEGGNERVLAVLGFVASHQLSISKLERIEASLESLFLEVVGQ